MPFPRPSVDIHRPPQDLDALVEWFELVSYNLVLLEDYSLEEIRTALESLTGAVEMHRQLSPLPVADSPTALASDPELLRLLTADHEWFRISIEQLWWFFGVVERDDHGGNRQALGQYGRLLAESLRRHRRFETDFRARGDEHRPTAVSRSPPSNAN